MEFVKVFNKSSNKIEDLKLKITLGFWKNLSFKKSELNLMYSDHKKLFEAVRLALYFGNKQDKGWACIADFDRDISEDCIEDIDDNNIEEKLSKAILENYPDAIQASIRQEVGEGEESKKK